MPQMSRCVFLFRKSGDFWNDRIVTPSPLSMAADLMEIDDSLYRQVQCSVVILSLINPMHR